MPQYFSCECSKAGARVKSRRILPPPSLLPARRYPACRYASLAWRRMLVGPTLEFLVELFQGRMNGDERIMWYVDQYRVLWQLSYSFKFCWLAYAEEDLTSVERVKMLQMASVQ